MSNQNGHISATLAFHANRHYDGDPAKSQWVSHYDDLPVFPSPVLSQIIRDRDLSGISLEIALEKRFTCYTAHEIVDTALIAQQLTLEGKKVAVMIDGQNFLGSYNETFPTRKLSPLQVIKEIIRRYDAQFVNFYTCWNELLNKSIVSMREKEEIDNDPQITVINRAPKKIKTGKTKPVIKSDIDCLIIPDLMDLRHSNPDLDGYVLLAGDSDYEHCLLKYMLKEGKAIEIVSSAGSISKELWTLGNLPTVMILFIDEILNKAPRQAS